MSNADHRKRTVYLGPETIREMERWAAELGRSVSWVAQQAVRIALPRLRQLPAARPAARRGRP